MQASTPIKTAKRLLLLRSHVNAFALIDSVLAAVLLVIMAASLQSLFEISRDGILFSNQLDQADLDIHAVIDDLRSLGMRYHYCNGKGVASTSIVDCSGATALLSSSPQNYYSPTITTRNPKTDLDAFKEACNFDTEGDMNKDQILNGGNNNGTQGLLGELKKMKDTPSRGVSIDYGQDNKENRRIRVTLTKTVELKSGTRTLTRQYYFAPTLALWCP